MMLADSCSKVACSTPATLLVLSLLHNGFDKNENRSARSFLRAFLLVFDVTSSPGQGSG
jgi:hypothetical protein